MVIQPGLSNLSMLNTVKPPEPCFRRYEMGLEKLVSSESAVGVMQVELKELQPKLIESGKEVAALMEVIDTETVEANKVGRPVWLLRR